MIIKPILGWSGYFVSDTGKIFSTRQTRKQREIKPFPAGAGYPMVSLRNGKSSSNLYVHRIVLSAFAGDRPSNIFARHLDGDIQNNQLSNLQWSVPITPEPKLTEHERMVARFHDGYTPVTESGCWLWERTTDKYGYGEFQIRGKTRKAHRASWILHHGDIPNGLLVLHKCDNPTCVNPSHLFLGTESDNSKDRVAKKRFIGERHPRAKLSDRDVWEIKQVHPYFREEELGTIYGVTRCAIRDIIVGRNWSHVEI